MHPYASTGCHSFTASIHQLTLQPRTSQWHVLIYIHASMHACMHLTCIHAYIPTYLHTYIHTYIHPCIHASMHMHTRIHAYTHTRIHTSCKEIPVYRALVSSCIVCLGNCLQAWDFTECPRSHCTKALYMNMYVHQGSQLYVLTPTLNFSRNITTHIKTYIPTYLHDKETYLPFYFPSCFRV